MQPLTGSLDPILDRPGLIKAVIFGLDPGLLGGLALHWTSSAMAQSTIAFVTASVAGKTIKTNSFAQVSAEETFDECKLDADKFAADFSLDDKAKVSVGEPGHPATAGARPNKKAIVGVGQELRCADHDTGVVAKVVPAVQLRMDLPKNTTDPRTKGKVVVYLRDADSIS